MTRYKWVAVRGAEGFPTTVCCRVARVSLQAFYGWHAARSAGPTGRERAEEALVAEIRQVHASSGGAYGSPRVTAELRARRRRINAKRVARLMRANEIAGIRPRRPKRSAAPARCGAVLPDLLVRRFSPGAPDRAQVSDITHVRTDAGWLYLAVVLDVGSRRLLGYSMGDRVDARLAADALEMAANTRAGRTAGIVLHRPRQPIPRRSVPPLRRRWGLSQSVGRVGTSADNAVAEAFFSSLKRELVNRRRWPDRATARRAVFEWLARYNTTRLHTSVGCVTPDQHEARYRHTTAAAPTLIHLTGQRGEAPRVVTGFDYQRSGRWHSTPTNTARNRVHLSSIVPSPKEPPCI